MATKKPSDHPDRRGSGERRKGERRREEDRRGTSGSGGGGRDSGFKRARRTYHDSQRGRSEAEPRRTYRDGKE